MVGTASVTLLRLGPAPHVLAQQGREANTGDKVREVSLPLLPLPPRVNQITHTILKRSRWHSMNHNL